MDSRPPPPQGAPPSYAFVTRVYRRSLRPFVLATAFLAGLWTLFGAIGYFRNAALDRLGDVPKLRTVYIIIGALYMVVAATEGLGLLAAATQRLPLVRGYAYLSGLSALIIVGTGLLRIIIHFTMKNDLINTCTRLTEGGTVVYFGFLGPVAHDLSQDEAHDWCQRAWDHDSWQEIVAFLITSALAAFFSSIAFGYYHQVRDPSSPANASRAPSYGVRNGAYPPYYNQPYSTTVPNLHYGQPGYDQHGEDAFVPPPYEHKAGYSGLDDKDNKNPFDDSYGSSSRTNGA